MGVFVFLPLVLPLTALPIARLAERHLHPRAATVLLTWVGCALAVCSTLCLALLMVVGTAQLPGNPLPDGWSDPEVRAAVPFDRSAGTTAIAGLFAVAVSWARTLRRHGRVRSEAEQALASLPPHGTVAVVPDDEPYAYALPGSPGRVVVSAGMMAALSSAERRALIAHEHAHLAAGHHRFLLAIRLAACANPFLWPLRRAVAFSTERWADEDAARAVANREVTARAVGKAALVTRGGSRRLEPGIAGFAAAGPVPRRVAALLDPAPQARLWPPATTRVGLAALMAAVGTTASAASSLNATVALVIVLKAATPL